MSTSIYPEWILTAFKKNNKEPTTITVAEFDKCDKILYGTFGLHVSEEAEKIMLRKIKETDSELGSLWGLTLEKDFSDYTNFCDKIKGNVYVLLKHTDSKNQAVQQGGKFLKCLYNGEEKVLADYGIEVQGKETQDKALVVEEYCLYEDLVSFPGVEKCYLKENGNDLCTVSPLTRLLRDKKFGLDMKSQRKKSNSFAIVLKLKYPYIVQCIDYQKNDK